MLAVAGPSSRGLRVQANQLTICERSNRCYSLASSSSRSRSRLSTPTRAFSSKHDKAHGTEEHSKPPADTWSLRNRLRKLTARVFPNVTSSAQSIPTTHETNINQSRLLTITPKGKLVNVNLKIDDVHYPSTSRGSQNTPASASIDTDTNGKDSASSAQDQDASKKIDKHALRSRAKIVKMRRRRAERRKLASMADSEKIAKERAKAIHSKMADTKNSKDAEKIAGQDVDPVDVKMRKSSEAVPLNSVPVPIGASKSQKRQFVQPGNAYEEWAEIIKSLNAQPPPDRDTPPHLSKEIDTAVEGIQESEKIRKSSPTIYRPSGRRDDAPQGELIVGASIPRYREVMPAQDLELKEMTTPSRYLPLNTISSFDAEKRKWWDQEGKWSWTVGGRLSAMNIPLTKVEPLRKMEVPQLAHGLDRVLFNPGVHWLRDSRSGIYNYEPRLRNIYDVDLFDYSALPAYVTSSKDAELAGLARRDGKRYTGSTSSMTALLSHIYFLISAWKQPDLSGFSSGFSTLPKSFSYGARLPACIYLRRFEETLSNGEKMIRYAIDVDKSAEGSDNNNYVLTQLGKSVEKLLTSKHEEYEKYLRINSHSIGPEEREKKEAYHYATSGKLLMRSQLDCSDERLPRKTFDLKTRAVIAVRQDRANWVESSGYLIRHATGILESFEREMWDMTRATLLKYYFQARIGHMDGILVAYHSTATMFGFQYLPCEDMAMKLFGSVEMGEQAFRLTLGMLENILDAITDIKPSSTLKIILDTEPGHDPKMLAFAQAVDESGVDIEETSKETSQEEQIAAEDNDHQFHREKKVLQLDVRVDRYLGEDLVRGPVDFSLPNGYRINVATEDEITRRKRASLPPLNWSLEYSITPRSDLSAEVTAENLQKSMERKLGLAPLILPNLEALNEREKLREQELSVNESALQKFIEDRRSGAVGMPAAPGQISIGEHHTISSDDGDAKAASANHEEAQAQAQAYSQTTAEVAPITQRWKRQTNAIERLRELARLGKQDKDREALTDLMQIYERRGD